MNRFEQRKIETQHIVDYLATKNINATYFGGGLMEVIYNSERHLIIASLPDAVDFYISTKKFKAE